MLCPHINMATWPLTPQQRVQQSHVWGGRAGPPPNPGSYEALGCPQLQNMQVANRGGLEALALDAVTRAVSPSYGKRVAAHEAAHFLVAYLLGLLPKRYTLSSLDAFQR